jgi:hypothetical protein
MWITTTAILIGALIASFAHSLTLTGQNAALRMSRDAAMRTLRLYVEKAEAEAEAHAADMDEVSAQARVLL